MGAERAFVHGPDLFVVIAGIIGAGSHAVLAADAFFLFDNDDSAMTYTRSAGRTNPLAGSVAALHALPGSKILTEIGVAAAQALLRDPVAVVVWSQRNQIFGLAGYSAGFAV
jgi:hypothetical protein